MWQPLEQAKLNPLTEEHIRETMRMCDMSREEAIASLEAEGRQTTYWLNDTYQVALIRHKYKDPDFPDLLQLNIRRRDGEAIFRDWREFQAIKNQLVGPEIEMVELYPAESRKADMSNKYHLWGFDDPAFRWPFGFQDRGVSYRSSTISGMKQRAYSGTPDGQTTD